MPRVEKSCLMMLSKADDDTLVIRVKQGFLHRIALFLEGN